MRLARLPFAAVALAACTPSPTAWPPPAAAPATVTAPVSASAPLPAPPTARSGEEGTLESEKLTKGDERHPVRLALGEGASFESWTVRWIALRDGLVRLEARRRGEKAGEWSASMDPRAATHEVETKDRLFALEVRLAGVAGRLDRSDGRIELVAHTVDLAIPAKLGQTLSAGVFAFPDGLRVAVVKTTECDFDPSAPCPFGGSYRVDAARGDEEAHVEVKGPKTKLPGHTLEMGRGTFVVR